MPETRKWLESLFFEISGGTSCIPKSSVLNVQKRKQNPQLFGKNSNPTLLYIILCTSFNHPSQLKTPSPLLRFILLCIILLSSSSCTLLWCPDCLKPTVLSLTMALLGVRQPLLQRHGHSPGSCPSLQISSFDSTH